MSNPPILLLGRIAVHLKLITVEQLADATHRQGQAPNEKRLGEILVETGMLTQAQLEKVLRARQQMIAKQRAKSAVSEALPEPEAGAVATPERNPDPPHGKRGEAARAASGASEGKSPRGEAARAASGASEGKSPRGEAARAASGGGSAELLARLRQGIERGASDVHIHAGSPFRLRLHGRFEAVGEEPIARDDAERMLRSALTPAQAERFDERGEVDFAWTVPDLGRFRVNVYRQLRGMDGVFRSIPARVPTLADLGLPTSLAKFTNYHQGLVLVTGPANCGKSSTLAALVDLINEERAEHILTVEDPIEVLHPAKRCVVNQRTVGPHTGSFARALRAALREDPDVIVIGELRDLETISLALTAAETGHLVFATLHTSGAIRTLNRVVGVFPADQQDQVRSMVSESLRAVISQRLVPAADGKRRVPALELLVNNKAVGNMIRENKAFQLQSVMQMGAAQGMALLDDSLARLVKEKVVAKEEALRHCEDPRRIP
jgi:twitching motility protein PilT